MTDAIEELGFAVDKHGNHYLKGKTFNKKVFSDLALSVDEPGQDITLEDCSFLNCEIDPGRFVFWWGVVLRNVVFDNVKHGGEIMIHSNTCVLDRVTIKRKQQSLLLWIKPIGSLTPGEAEIYRRWINKHTHDTEFVLDISEFNGDVQIYGLPVDKVIVNSAKHVKLQLNGGRIDCDHEGVKTNFWQILLGDAADFSETDGILPTVVTRLPLAKDRDYDAVLKDLEKLKRMGVVVK